MKKIIFIFLALSGLLLCGCANKPNNKPIINYNVASGFFSEYQIIRNPNSRYEGTRYSNDKIIGSGIYMSIKGGRYINAFASNDAKNGLIINLNGKQYHVNNSMDSYLVNVDNIAYTQCSDLFYNSTSKSNLCLSNIVYLNDKIIYQRDMSELSDKGKFSFSIYSPSLLYFDDKILIYSAFYDDSSKGAMDAGDKYFKYDIKSGKTSEIDISNIPGEPSFVGTHILSYTTRDRNLGYGNQGLNIFLDGKPYYNWGQGIWENKKIDFMDTDKGNGILTLMKGDDVYFAIYYHDEDKKSEYNMVVDFYKNKEKIFEMREDDSHYSIGNIAYLTDGDDNPCVIETMQGQGIGACVFSNSIFYYSLDGGKWGFKGDYFIDGVKINFGEKFMTGDLFSGYTSLIDSTFPAVNNVGKIEKIVFSSQGNIYVSNYLGDGEISTPQVLVSNLPGRLGSRLLGVIKK